MGDKNNKNCGDWAAKNRSRYHSPKGKFLDHMGKRERKKE